MLSQTWSYLLELACTRGELSRHQRWVWLCPLRYDVAVKLRRTLSSCHSLLRGPESGSMSSLSPTPSVELNVASD